MFWKWQPFVELTRWAVSVIFENDLLQIHCNFLLFENKQPFVFSHELHKVNYDYFLYGQICVALQKWKVSFDARRSTSHIYLTHSQTYPNDIGND